MGKYRYYFQKPRSEMVKDILSGLLTVGLISIAATSPYFGINLIKGFKFKKTYKKKRIYNTFSRLKQSGLINVKYQGPQMHISLTKEGKKRAGWMQIDDLNIKKPKKWDTKWRIVIFDISELKRMYREAFRGKLKDLGFISLQRSVWIQPYNCEDEIALLRQFFGLKESEMRLMTVENIGDDSNLRKTFKI